MQIEYDETKRQKTLEERGLDFAKAAEVFENVRYEVDDDRHDYGEARYITYGELDGRAVAIVWTQRGKSKRIISMRHAHGKELEARKRTLG